MNREDVKAVPVWWPIATALLAGLFSAGGTYATFGYRLSNLETDVATIKVERKEAIQEWSIWRARTENRVTKVEDGIDHMAKTLDRVADKLGVYR